MSHNNSTSNMVTKENKILPGTKYAGLCAISPTDVLSSTSPCKKIVMQEYITLQTLPL